jgi:peptidoglycan/LPS O-acetylase OafA/YrhL
MTPATTEAGRWELVDFLKGVAISLVLVSHFAYLYAPDFYLRWLNNYANAFIGIFFLIAGYSAYISFERRFLGSGPRTSVILRYWWDRATRIYPLYWLALVIIQIVKPLDSDVQLQSIGDIVSAILLLPHFESPLWFVTAIVQCYIFAPLVYLLLRRLGVRRFTLLITLSGLVLLSGFLLVPSLTGLESISQIPVKRPYVFLYRGIPLGNVMLFSLGMMFPPVLKRYGERVRSLRAFHASAVLLVVYLVFLRYDEVSLHRATHLIELSFFLVLSAFFFLSLASGPSLPFSGPVGYLGKRSYSLYIFHGSFFQILALIGILEPYRALSIILTALCLPLLIGFCELAERRWESLRVRFLDYQGVKSAA